MQDPYENEPYTPDEIVETAPRRRMSGWLIALIVVVVLLILCCVCAFLVVLVFIPVAGTNFSTIIQTIEVMTPVVP